MSSIEKMDLESKDLVAERVKQLKTLFPEIEVEGDGTIDFEKLRLILGDEVDEEQEHYAFTWPGKADAIRQAQTPSTATLRPDEDASVDWDTTENLYIEGDNLEVLKLLQRGYHGKVKMIYIDPPYNTGHDFVYKDSFQDSIENYREQAGLSGQSNADTSGRYHSDWLSMMYPRLRLARELLSDDGVIFISIDDNEDKNLRNIADEVFGEVNFLAQVVWERAFAPINLKKNFSTSHDYILVYAKDSSLVETNGIARSEEADSLYKNPDNDPRGVWQSDNLTVGPAVPANVYEIITPSGRVVTPPSGRSWLFSKQTFEEKLADNRIWFGKDGDSVPRFKRFLSELRKTGITPMTIWKYDEVGHSQEATQSLQKLMDNKRYFDYPKPIKLLKRCVQLYTNSDSLILDFFSGSGTLAHAIIEQNSSDGGNRRYILVQLPEPFKKDSNATKDGYSDLCKFGEERIRRAGQKIKDEIEEENKQLKLGEEPKPVPDIGFRVLKLDSSNFEEVADGALIDDLIKSGRTNDDIIFEMMLKWGLELSLPMEKTEIAGYPVTSIAADELICCMDEGLTIEVLEAIAALEPKRVFFLDSALTDTIKLNAVQIFKRIGDKLGYEIELRTA